MIANFFLCHLMQGYGQGQKMSYPSNQMETTREIGYLKFANYTANVSDGSSYDNLLNNIWYQPKQGRSQTLDLRRAKNMLKKFLDL